VTEGAAQLVRQKRSEFCLFSAWDLHFPPDQPEKWQMIEFNDNGSGLLFAELINRKYYDTYSLAENKTLKAPPKLCVFNKFIADMIRHEAKAFFGKHPISLLLILDDSDSLQQGKFRQELLLLRNLLRDSGWKVEISSPSELLWDGKRLSRHGSEVSFIINRSTDFLWQADCFAALRAAYRKNKVYVAPNPFTYATRSNKRLLEFLSQPDWDRELGISAQERAVLSAHVPKTHLICANNMEEIARKKEEFFFKPASSFAGRGIIKSSQMGRARLHRLVKKEQAYVAQIKVPKTELSTKYGTAKLWTDLRVWAYRSRRFMLSGRASTQPDLLDLRYPGGWLPTYAYR
jgi:hypothetical protein